MAYEWDKTKPLGTQAGSDLDDAIRDTRSGVEAMLGTEHTVDVSNPAAVTATHKTGFCVAAYLAANAVETAKIKDANVTAAKLAANAVETAKIKDANVTAAKLATDAVETAKLKDGAVTLAKLANNAQSLAANGYSTLPGGLIIQWGSVYFSSGGTITVTLPMAFPNAHVSGSVSGTSQAVGVLYGNKTKTGMEIYSNSGQTVLWVAIGY
jgi:hypothetical protein